MTWEHVHSVSFNDGHVIMIRCANLHTRNLSTASPLPSFYHIRELSRAWVAYRLLITLSSLTDAVFGRPAWSAAVVAQLTYVTCMKETEASNQSRFQSIRDGDLTCQSINNQSINMQPRQISAESVLMNYFRELMTGTSKNVTVQNLPKECNHLMHSVTEVEVLEQSS